MTFSIEKNSFYAAEAAVLLNLSVQTVYRFIHTGVLTAYKDIGGHSWKIPADAIVNYQAKMINASRKDNPNE